MILVGPGAMMLSNARHEPGRNDVPPTTTATTLEEMTHLAGSARQGTGSHLGVGMTDREHLLERLQSLRGILPVFAQELASARRQAAALRIENRGLHEEVRRLRRLHAERSLSAGGK